MSDTNYKSTTLSLVYLDADCCHCKTHYKVIHLLGVCSLIAHNDETFECGVVRKFHPSGYSKTPKLFFFSILSFENTECAIYSDNINYYIWVSESLLWKFVHLMIGTS